MTATRHITSAPRTGRREQSSGRPSRFLAAVGSGFLGACATTLLHETIRRTVPHAPRMDILGERAIERGMHWAGYEPPRGERLHEAALAGDLVANTAYYSLVGVGSPRHAMARGAAIGLIAGLGAATLPGPLGLGTAPATRTSQTALMTVGLYLGGGLVAGAAFRWLGR